MVLPAFSLYNSGAFLYTNDGLWLSPLTSTVASQEPPTQLLIIRAMLVTHEGSSDVVHKAS